MKTYTAKNILNAIHNIKIARLEIDDFRTGESGRNPEEFCRSIDDLLEFAGYELDAIRRTEKLDVIAGPRFAKRWRIGFRPRVEGAIAEQ